MKLNDGEAARIASALVTSLMDKIGTQNLDKLAHERIVSEIVEMMDDLEDRVDTMVTTELVKNRPQKVSVNTQWWNNE